jgi:hypothetical protein
VDLPAQPHTGAAIRIEISKRQQLISKKRLKARGTRARAKRVRGGLWLAVSGPISARAAGPIKSGRPGPNIEVVGNVAGAFGARRGLLVP